MLEKEALHRQWGVWVWARETCSSERARVREMRHGGSTQRRCEHVLIQYYPLCTLYSLTLWSCEIKLSVYNVISTELSQRQNLLVSWFVVLMNEASLLNSHYPTTALLNPIFHAQWPILMTNLCQTLEGNDYSGFQTCSFLLNDITVFTLFYSCTTAYIRFPIFKKKSLHTIHITAHAKSRTPHISCKI